MKIFIFRRDLRIHDNHGLNIISNSEETVLPVFLMDDQQVYKNKRNKYFFSSNALQFMCESLVDLNNELLNLNSRLVVMIGDPIDSLRQLIEKYKPSTVGFNADWSEYGLKRDQRIKDLCYKHRVKVIICYTDSSLHPINKLVKTSKEPYYQFGAFYKNATKLGKPVAPLTAQVKFVTNISHKNKGEIDPRDFSKLLYVENSAIAQRGGRKEALIKLKHIKLHKDYNQTRDLLNVPTTMLSGALNFGCVSIRETYYTFLKSVGAQNDLLKQLYWRDFFLQIVATTTDARSFKKHINPEFDTIRWVSDSTKIRKEYKKLWESKTGFLLVDAAMAEMRKTGFMHNRARMLVGVFWTKYLRIHILHPKYGSQVGFSSQLLDAVGPSQNKLNHHWITELDLSGRRYAPRGYALSGRPMKISNLMIKRWDPKGLYIKKWLPHLQFVPINTLVRWGEQSNEYEKLHPHPMFDEKKRYMEWIKATK